MISEEHKAIIEQYLGNNSKNSLQALSAIFDHYNNSTIANNCWCSRRARESALTTITEWYNITITNEQESN